MAATAALIAAGIAAAAATAGAVGNAVNREKANAERSRVYKESKNILNSEYYRDPLSSVGNKALLKSLDQRMQDSTKAMENRAVAGGATYENQLAARKANNETMSRVFTNLLQGEDARKAAITQQQLQLDQRYSAGVQASYLQAAQNWQAWGTQMANAALSYGSSSLLGGAGAGFGSGVSSVGSASTMPNNYVTGGGNGLAGGLAGINR